MERSEALKLVESLTENGNLIKHMYATEAAMGALADHFGTSEEEKANWMLAGLMHDADYEKYPDKHPAVILEKLKEVNAPQVVVDAIRRHAWGYNNNEEEPVNNMDWSLYTCDELTGLIVACALVKDKKLSLVTLDTVKKKWGQKAFAKGVHREQIEMCEEKLGIKLDDFIGIVLKSMQGIAKDLGL